MRNEGAGDHRILHIARKRFCLSIPWWGRRDSNPHDRSHMLLRHARLPFRHASISQWYLPSLTPLDSSFHQSNGVVHLLVDVRVDALYVAGVVFTTPVSTNWTSSSTALHRRRNDRDPGSFSARQRGRARCPPSPFCVSKRGTRSEANAGGSYTPKHSFHP